MKNFKKILSCFVASATIISSVGITKSYNYGVEALSIFDDCDVNEDGNVDIRDAQAISRYLAGNLYDENYNRFDTNKSLIIDNMDVEYVMTKIMKKSYSNYYFSRKNLNYTNAPSTSDSILDADISAKVGREYMRYSYTKKVALKNYTLTPTTKTLSDTTNTYAMIRAAQGTDDRYMLTSDENTGIVNVKSGGTSGTGFIVGDHQIATNAHIVYINDKNKWKDSIEVYTYNSKGERTSNKLTAVEAHIPKNYIDTKSGKYDYALITVKEDLSNYVQFDLGASYNVNLEHFENIPLYVTGCSGLMPDGQANQTAHLFSGEGNIVDYYYDDNGKKVILSNKSVLHYNVDTTPGNSGSPVYTITKTTINNQSAFVYTAIGIHSAGTKDKYNCGPIITKYLLQFYKNNGNISY